MRVAISETLIAGSWRLLLMRGGLVFALALAALPWPESSLYGIVLTVSSIALVSGLLDAALFGVFHRDAAGKWALLAEAFIGVTLGGALLVYPIVPLALIGALLALWMLGRGAMLASVGLGEVGDGALRFLAVGWGTLSIATVIAMLVAWSAATILSLSYLLVAYALIWGALEMIVARRLRSRAYATSA